MLLNFGERATDIALVATVSALAPCGNRRARRVSQLPYRADELAAMYWSAGVKRDKSEPKVGLRRSEVDTISDICFVK